MNLGDLPVDQARRWGHVVSVLGMGLGTISVGPIMHEPLLQLVMAGGLLLVAAHRLCAGISRPVIELTPEWIKTLARDFEVKFGQPPDSAERKKLIRDCVKSEILYR